MITYPSSIRHHAAVKRAFQAKNGELAFQPADAEVFISACENESLAVVRWEVWVVDHRLSFSSDPKPVVYSQGEWCPLIPKPDGTTALQGGDTERNPEENWSNYVIRSNSVIREQISAFSLDKLVDPSFAEFVRFNFLTQERSD